MNRKPIMRWTGTQWECRFGNRIGYGRDKAEAFRMWQESMKAVPALDADFSGWILEE